MYSYICSNSARGLICVFNVLALVFVCNIQFETHEQATVHPLDLSHTARSRVFILTVSAGIMGFT